MKSLVEQAAEVLNYLDAGGTPSRRMLRALAEAIEREGSRDELYVNEERTVLFRRFAESGVAEVATREHSSYIWGPPIKMERA